MSAFISTAGKYGGSFNQPSPATHDATAVTQVAPIAVHPAGGAISPSHPLFWLVALTAGVLGLAAYSTTGRV
jgi:hypothetical protein